MLSNNLAGDAFLFLLLGYHTQQISMNPDQNQSRLKLEPTKLVEFIYAVNYNSDIYKPRSTSIISIFMLHYESVFFRESERK